MIKKNITSLLSLLFLLLGNLMIFAQLEGPDDGDDPTEGLGATSPIDMYVYVLVFVAFLLIVYSKRMKQKKVA
jgi:hypothetical protein